MLLYKAIDAPTLEILKSLLQIPAFRKLRLVGGTSLALQLGHRKSIDIDLFGSLDADEQAISKSFRDFKSVKILQKSENITIYSIEGIKVDIVNYSYPWLSPVIEEDGIRLAQMDDIAAMKLSAITGRGTKKDFVDIAFLLQRFNLRQMLEFYTRKYYDGSEFLVIKSLTYFDDADQEKDPIMLKEMKWEETKRKLVSKLEEIL